MKKITKEQIRFAANKAGFTTQYRHGEVDFDPRVYTLAKVLLSCSENNQEVIDGSANKSVANMIDDGCKIVMCEVSHSSKYDTATKVRGIVSYHRCSQGYVQSYKDTDGSSWDYAIPINMDGSRLTVHEYNKTKG